MDVSDDSARSAWLRGATFAAPMIVCGAYLVVHALGYLFFVEDDSYISMRYAERLLAGRGLTWNDGEYVEGYSNLLWVLATALLGALGLDLVDATRVLGLSGALAAVAAVAWAYRASTPRYALPALAGGFVLAAVEHVPVWAVGGLETCMLAGLLAWALVTCYPLLTPMLAPTRAVIVPGALLGLVCLTRPDGPLFTAAACLGLLLVRGPSRASVRLATALAAIPLTCTLGQVAFRVIYYGDPLPNTAHAKLGFSLQRVVGGALHLGPAFLYAAPVVVAAAWAFVLARRDPAALRRLRFLAVALVLWTVYAVCIGGDTFRGRRHFVPDIVVLALMVAEGARVAVHLGARARQIAWAAFAVLGAALVQLQPHDARLPRAEWAWPQDGVAIGEFLRSAFGEQQPLLAVEPAGGPPYASRLPAVDMLGLNDPVLAHMRPETFGSGRVGHELGDGEYTLSRRPDILMFCRPRNDGRACFRGSQQLMRKQVFRREHRRVRIDVRGPKRVVSQIWFRVEDGKLGLIRTARRIEIPGFLMASEHEAAAMLSAQHRIIARIRPGQSGGYDRIKLPAGQWDLTVEHEGVPLIVKVRHERMTEQTGRTHRPMRLEIPRGHRIDLELHNASQKDARVVRVVFTRAP